MSASTTSSENTVSRKYDKCLADLVVKAGVGFSIGVVASAILFRRRAWPVALSTGFGMGAAYADCDRLFNPARVPGTRPVLISSAPPNADLRATTPAMIAAESKSTPEAASATAPTPAPAPTPTPAPAPAPSPSPASPSSPSAAEEKSKV